MNVEHYSFLGCSGTNWSSEVELDILELGQRTMIMLDEENNAWGAAGMLFWLTEDFSETGNRR